MGSTELSADEVMALVGHLFDKSLIIGDEGSTYRLLQTVREFCQELPLGDVDHEPTRLRHFEYFCSFARKCEERIRGSQQQVWHKTYLSAQDDLRAALDFGFERPELNADASEMTFDLSAFWFNAGNFIEANHYYQYALDACPAGDSDLRARLMRRGAMMRLYGGDMNAGETMKDALGMALRVGSDRTIADAYFSYGLQSQDARVAIEHLEEALSRFEQLGDAVGIAFALAGIGELAFVESDYVTAKTFYTLAIKRARDSGDIRAEGASVACMASIDLAEGRLEEARRGFQKSIALILESGVVFNIYSMFPLVIRFIQLDGQKMEAARLIGWSEKVRRSVGGIRDRMDEFVFQTTDRELREEFGEGAYAALLAEGNSLANDEAIKRVSQCLCENAD